MMQYIGTGRLGPAQFVAYTGTAGIIGAGVGSQTYKVRVVCTTDAFVMIDGTTPSNINGAYMPAFAVEYFTITPGQKVSAVQVTAGGTMYVTEIV